MQDENLSRRALNTSLWTAAVVVIYCFAAGRTDWGWGYVLGAALSLFSMATLTIGVPILFRPGSASHTHAMCAAMLLMKLPLFMAGLYAMTHLSAISLLAATLGIGLVPIVLTCKAIGAAITEIGPAKGAPPVPEFAQAIEAAAVELVQPARRPARVGGPQLAARRG